MKKVLFITYDFPYPTNTGGKNRAYHMLKYSGQGFKKYLFSFVRPDFDLSYVKNLEEIGVEVIGTELRRSTTDLRNMFGLLSSQSIFKAIYYSDKTFTTLLQLIRKYEIDIVHFESFYTGFYVSDEIKHIKTAQVYGSENIEYKMYQDYAKQAPFFLRPIYEQQVKRIKREEERMMQNADVSIAVSDTDAKEIKKHSNRVGVVRNGVDVEDFKFVEVRKEATNLLFVGNFSYFPNVDAINFFYNEVFKNLDENLKLTIIGKKVSSLPFVQDKRIETIEFIPDIHDAYKNADIMVAPIRMGGGTNFKILEAMAAGVPVVSLPQRLEGLDVMSGKNIMVADNALEFKDAIDKLVGDYELRDKISRAGRKLVEEEYSWKVIGRKLAELWNSYEQN